jgi:uncharacterized protein (TIGR03067 family)
MSAHAVLWTALLVVAGDVPPADVNAVKTEAADASAADRAKMQGDWMAVSMMVNGSKLADDEAQILFRTVTGEKYTVFRFSNPIGQGTFKIDATKRPKTIDSTPAGSRSAGAAATGKSKPILGIYELDGDTLKICNSLPGKPRPTDFAAKTGSSHTRIVWQREKK